jgi:hypothetical protein
VDVSRAADTDRITVVVIPVPLESYVELVSPAQPRLKQPELTPDGNQTRAELTDQWDSPSIHHGMPSFSVTCGSAYRKNADHPPPL